MAIDTYNTQKHHFEDVENHPFQLEGFGNLGNLLHARRLMERYEPTLPPCAEDGHTVTRAYRQHAPNAGAVQGYM